MGGDAPRLGFRAARAATGPDGPSALPRTPPLAALTQAPWLWGPTASLRARSTEEPSVRGAHSVVAPARAGHRAPRGSRASILVIRSDDVRSGDRSRSRLPAAPGG